MSAESRVAWVIGGGTGIGLGCVLSLSSRGWMTAISGRNTAATEGAARRASEITHPSVSVRLDATDQDSVAKALAKVLGSFGHLDTLVYCAGTNQRLRRWSSMTSESFDAVMNVNLGGVYRVIHQALPALRRQGGSIIVIGSWAGYRFDGRVGPAYTTSKSALGGLLETLNAEEHGHGIRATLLEPGETRTDILKKRPVVPTEEEQAQMLQPEDVGEAVAWIAEQPPRVCVNRVVLTPTANFYYAPFADDPLAES